jgi:hypothetical protein
MLPLEPGGVVVGLPLPGVIVPSEFLEEPVVPLGAASFAVLGFCIVPPDWALGGLPAPPPTCADAAVIESAKAQAVVANMSFFIFGSCEIFQQQANVKSRSLFR